MESDIDTSEEVGAAVPAKPPRENIVRAILPGVELRTSEDGARILHGHFAKFDEPTVISSVREGTFVERIAPGAFKKTIRENGRNMKVLFDHGHDPTVGNKPLGPIRALEEDDIGARYEVELLDTSYNRDLIPALEAGLLGASFRFSVVREDVVDRPEPSDYNPRGLPERTIREAKVAEFGPVCFPAYLGATAGVRSLTDEYEIRRFLEQPEVLRDLLLRFLPAATGVAPEDSPTSADADHADLERSPGEASSVSTRGLFWFANTPDHLKGNKDG